jgi:hypothetical protein
LIIGYLGSPKNSVFNNENLTSLPRTVPELFNLQPTAFYFEMDSSSAVNEDRIFATTKIATSNETGEELGGSGSENHEVWPSGQIDSASVR